MRNRGGYADPVLSSEDRGDRDYDTAPDIARQEVGTPTRKSIPRGGRGRARTQGALLRQQLKQEKQVTKWRQSLFGKMMVLVICVEAVSVVLLVCYVLYVILGHRDMDTTFLSVWFVSNVAQVIGILAVITNHLFPDRGKADNKERDGS